MIINFKYLGQTGGSSSGGGMTSGDVQTLIESYNYVNSGQVETQITNKGYVNQNTLTGEFYDAVGEDLLHAGGVQSVLETAGIVVPNSEESDLVINVLPTATSDLTNDSGYITSADTQNFLTSADTQNFITSADTYFVSTDAYEEDAEVISTALNDLNTRMSGVVVSDGSVSRIVKVTQSAYDEMASAGTIDDNTVYYIVADPTPTPTFDAETYCTQGLNGTWDGATCEFEYSDPGEGGTNTANYSAYYLQKKWECEQAGNNWDYGNMVCIDPDCEGVLQCECESRGGAWVEDGEMPGEYYCDECGSAGGTTEEAAAYNECNCLRNGGTWTPNPENSEGGECQYPDEGGEA